MHACKYAHMHTHTHACIHEFMHTCIHSEGEVETRDKQANMQAGRWTDREKREWFDISKLSYRKVCSILTSSGGGGGGYSSS